MQAAQVLAGYTLGGADLLRRAMGKKDKEKMAKERVKFCDGAAKLHGIPEEKANEIFDTLEKFAGYGFNRSHSAAYAWVSYQTAYLKANYPVEFMAAVMSNEVANMDKISVFVGECERLGIQLLAPDVNRSGLKFEPEEVIAEGVAALKSQRRADRATEAGDGEAPEPEVSFEDLPSGKSNGKGDAAPVLPPAQKPRVGSIRYGLAAIKNVGEAAMVAAIAEREKHGAFKSLDDFCGRIDSRKISRKAIECLIKCGAFDFAKTERSRMFAEVESAMASAASAHRDKAAGQSSLFGDMAEVAKPVTARRGGPPVAPWPLSEKLAYEKELLGFYVTGHPLDEYRGELEKSKYTPIARLAEQENKTTVTIAGQLAVVEKKFTKKDGKPFAVVVLEDLTDQLEVMVWNDAYTKAQRHLEAGKVVAITGRLDIRDEGPRVTADKVEPLAKAAGKETKEKPLILTLRREKATLQDLERIRDLIREHPGRRRVEFRLNAQDGTPLRLIPADEFSIDATSEVQAQLAEWLE
jgi:DNA polymerase-3 subunit alpha